MLKPCTNPGCNGQMIKEGDTFICLLCGHPWQSPKVRHKFIEVHKDEIIEDYHNMTLTAMLKKWSISTAGWWRISRRWGLNHKIGNKKVTETENEREELHYLRGYKQCLSDLLNGDIEMVLRIVDSTPVLTNNKK